MKILLDTQCWLWMITNPDRLSPHAQRLLTDGDNTLWLSVASVWEIAIKHGLGKLRLPTSPTVYVPAQLAATRVASMVIQPEHALRVGELPPHHRDPFDRLVIAQAQLERMPIMTADPRFHEYDVDVLAA
ncbi:MAG: type II toxin-antitoxin system VapC family toxin [Gemmatimonadales bacterium]